MNSFIKHTVGKTSYNYDEHYHKTYGRNTSYVMNTIIKTYGRNTSYIMNTIIKHTVETHHIIMMNTIIKHTVGIHHM